MWGAAGFMHWFLVLSEQAGVVYSATGYRCSEYQHCLLWSDPEVGIEWQGAGERAFSAGDAAGLRLADLIFF
jgi:dTDP-4-dehydrorhamnose 3,5-epimerase